MNNNFRRMLCVLTATSLAAFALPSMAAGPQKTYSIKLAAQANYVGGVVQAPVPMTVTVKNESPPSSANSNAGSFQVTLAGLAIDHSQPISCPQAQCSANGNTISVTNISPPIQAQVEFVVSFSATSCGDGSATNVAVFTGSQLNGAAFKISPSASVLTANVSCGDLACATSFTVPDSTGSIVSGTRGLDKDGVCFVDSLPYYVTNTLPVVHVRWPVGADVNADSAAAFKYAVTATTSGNPLVAWLTDNQGNPVFISALTLPCAGDLPASYTTLASDVSVSDKKIQVTSTPAGLPAAFPIVIGTERMQVTKANTNQWTVTRHTGGTSATAHFTTDDVMSTPLGLVPVGSPAPYTAGNQAQMCLFSQSGNLTTVIDIGDGWVNSNP